MLGVVIDECLQLPQAVRGRHQPNNRRVCRPCRQPTFPVLKALRNTLIFHLGSVALGAFIIAIIQFVRVRQ